MLSIVFAGRRPPPPPGGLALFDEACALDGGVLIARDGAVVAETATCCEGAAGHLVWRDGALMARVWPLTSICFVPGDSVYLQQAFDDNYDRWLVEVLPRVAVAAQFVDLARFRSAITRVEGHMGRMMREGLALFGVKPEQIVEIDRGPVIFERLLYPLPVAKSIPGSVAQRHRSARILARQDWRGAGRSEADLRDQQRRSDPPPDQGGRGDRRIAAIWLRCRRPGPIVLCRANWLFAGAERIVGNCGAGLTNLVFAPRGVRVFALTTPFMQDDFFWDLTELKQGRFYSLAGASPDPARGPEADFSIDLAAFKEMLADFI